MDRTRLEEWRVSVLRGLCEAYRVGEDALLASAPLRSGPDFTLPYRWEPFRRLCEHERCDALLGVLDRMFADPGGEWYER